MIGGGARAVQFKQAQEDFFVLQIGGPAVGGGGGGIQFGVNVREPSGAFIVELGEDALLEFRGALGDARSDARVVRGADSAMRVHRCKTPKGLCESTRRE